MRTLSFLSLFYYLIMAGCNQISESNNNELAKKSSESTINIFVSWPGTEAKPHYYWPTGDDKPKGIEPRLIELILNKAELPYQYVPHFDFSGNGDPRIEAILTGAADIAIRAISVTPERKKQVNFTTPYYSDGLSALVRKDSPVNSLEDLNDKRVFAHSYTTAYNWVKENLPESDLITFDLKKPQHFGAEQLLLQDSIDALVLDYTFLKYEVKKFQELRVLDEKFTFEPLAIAVDKDNTKLLNKINEAIRELEGTRDFQAIIDEFEN